MNNFTDIETLTETKEVVTETYIISGKILGLLKDYAKTRFLSKSKYAILKLVIGGGGVSDIDSMSTELKLSRPLIAYHMNGTLKYDGLIGSELLKSKIVDGKLKYSVTDFGKFIFEFANVSGDL